MFAVLKTWNMLTEEFPSIEDGEINTSEGQTTYFPTKEMLEKVNHVVGLDPDRHNGSWYDLDQQTAKILDYSFLPEELIFALTDTKWEALDIVDRVLLNKQLTKTAFAVIKPWKDIKDCIDEDTPSQFHEDITEKDLIQQKFVFKIGSSTNRGDYYEVIHESNSKSNIDFIHSRFVYSNLPSLDAATTIAATLFPTLYSETSVSTQNQNTIEEFTQNQNTKKENRMKDIATGLVQTNKTNATLVARVTAGKAINKKVIKMIKPKLPFAVRSFADHALAPMVFANLVGMAIKTYTDNKKANAAADMMLEAAAFQTADAFNLDDMIEDLLDGISMPNEVTNTFNIDSAGMAELREFAKSKGIDLTGVNGIDNIRATIAETIIDKAAAL